jgi:hypothetical protein
MEPAWHGFEPGEPQDAGPQEPVEDPSEVAKAAIFPTQLRLSPTLHRHFRAIHRIVLV